MTTTWVTNHRGDQIAMTSWTIRETIHHGDYRNTRRVTVDATPAGLSELLAGSPYNRTAAHACDHLARMFDELDVDGITELGWATYELLAVATPERGA